MLLNKRPIQCTIVLYELAMRGDRGLSSYRAYDNNFKVKRLAARIDDLENKYGCEIKHEGSRPAIYTLISVPPETIAILAQGEPELMELMDHYIHVDFSRGIGNLTPIEKKVAESTGKLVRRFDNKTNQTWLEPVNDQALDNRPVGVK